MGVTFPIICFEKDKGSFFIIKKKDDIDLFLEPLDIEENEYLFWNSEGLAISATLNGEEVAFVDNLENIDFLGYIEKQGRENEELSSEIESIIFTISLFAEK